MSDIQDFVAHVTDSQKKSPKKTQIDKLLEIVKTELQSTTPDYDGCVLALTTFSHQIIGVFYDNVYIHFPKNVCASFDLAFLRWAESRPKIAGKNLAYLKMAQAIKKRLPIVSSADELLPELQWYISNFDDSRAAKETKKMRDECELTDLQKLLALDVQNWHTDWEMLKKFYGILFSDFTGPTTKKLYQEFLLRNHLVSESSSELAFLLSQKRDALDNQTKRSTSGIAPSSSMSKDILEHVSEHRTGVLPIPQQSSTAAEGPVNMVAGKFEGKKMSPSALTSESESSHKQTTVVSMDNGQGNIFSAETGSLINTTHALPADTPNPSEVLLSTPQQDSAEFSLEKDGVKLAELLLAWSRKQASGTAALKESLRMSERESNRLGTQLSSLRDELFAAKKELSGRDAEIASLRSQLAEAAAHLDSSRKQAAEFDETIRKLQRMNENSASQAVAGYKTELADALKSIVEDARLPEAQKDADILSALLGDLLDTLRFKGIPLEEK